MVIDNQGTFIKQSIGEVKTSALLGDGAGRAGASSTSFAGREHNAHSECIDPGIHHRHVRDDVLWGTYA